MCQHWVLPGTKTLTYGFHPCQDRFSLVLQYETHVYLIENTGLYIAFYLFCVRLDLGWMKGGEMPRKRRSCIGLSFGKH